MSFKVLKLKCTHTESFSIKIHMLVRMYFFLCLCWLTQSVFQLHPFTCIFLDFIFSLWLNKILLCHLYIHGHLCCFHVLAIVNRGSTDMAEQVSLQGDIGSFGCRARSDIARWYGRSTCSFLRILHNDFHSGCASVWTHKAVNKGSLLSLQAHQHLLSIGVF